MEMINVLIIVVATQLHTLVKSHQTVQIKRMNFNVYNSINLTLKKLQWHYLGAQWKDSEIDSGKSECKK